MNFIFCLTLTLPSRVVGGAVARPGRNPAQPLLMSFLRLKGDFMLVAFVNFIFCHKSHPQLRGFPLLLRHRLQPVDGLRPAAVGRAGGGGGRFAEFRLQVLEAQAV